MSSPDDDIKLGKTVEVTFTREEYGDEGETLGEETFNIIGVVEKTEYGGSILDLKFYVKVRTVSLVREGYPTTHHYSDWFRTDIDNIEVKQ